MKNILLLFYITFSLCVTLFGKSRDFYDQNGNKLRGELVQVENDEAVIQRIDGKKFTIPVARFSKSDQLYFEEFQRAANVSSAKPESTHVRPDKWPRRSGISGAVGIEIVSEDNAKGEFIYRSENFEFHAPTKLGRSDVREFARVFEATLAAVQEMPHPWEVKKAGEFFFVQLFEDDDAYHKSGATEGSGGVFQPSTKSILVPYKSLGLEKTSSGYSIKGDPRLKILVHEVFHQVTLISGWAYKMGSFFLEGSAQLLDSVPYKNGIFDWNKFSVDTLVEEYGEETPVRRLEDIIYISGKEWVQAFSDNTYAINYRTALIYYYYLTFLANDEVGGVAHDLIVAARTGQPIKEAVQQYLVKNKSFDALQEDIKKAFEREGLILRIQ